MSTDNEEAWAALVGIIANWDVLVVPPKQTLGHIHLADTILVAGWLSPEQVERAKAEVWERGAYAGREYQKYLHIAAHWSYIGTGEPPEITNPYREAMK